MGPANSSNEMLCSFHIFQYDLDILSPLSIHEVAKLKPHAPASRQAHGFLHHFLHHLGVKLHQFAINYDTSVFFNKIPQPLENTDV